MRVPAFVRDWMRRTVGDPPLTYLYMDETTREDGTTIAALTGLLVPALKYQAIRQRFYEILGPFIETKPNHFQMPPEVKGAKLLGETDEQKLALAQSIVDLVVHHGLRWYRVGYYQHPTLQSVFSKDPGMFGIAFTSMILMLDDEELAVQHIMPIMDGFDQGKVDRFSQPLQFSDAMRGVGRGSMLSYEHSENIIGEVAYVDSKYSALTQVVDVVCFLRNLTDMVDNEMTLTPWQKRLLPMAEQLSAVKGQEQTIPFQHEGVVYGPQNKVKPSTGKGALRVGFHPVLSDEPARGLR